MVVISLLLLNIFLLTMHEFKYLTAMVVLSKVVNVDFVNEQTALESVVHAFFPTA
jgi:hypothetical protein